MATLSKRSDTGAFFVQFFDSDRRPTRKRVYLKDDDGQPVTRRREAEPMHKALVRKYDLGTWCPWDGDLVHADEPPEYAASLREALDAFVHFKALSLKPVSVSGYRNTLGPLVRDLGPDRRVHTLTAQEVMEVVAARKVKPTTANGYINQMGVFLRWAHAEGITRTNLSERLAAPAKPESSLLDKFIPPPALKALLNHIDAAADRHHWWIGSVTRFGVNTGLRNTEVRTTTWADLVLESTAPRVVVPAERAKNSKSRTVPLNGEALEAVREVRERARDAGRLDPGQPVFQDDRGPLTRDHVTKVFKRYVEETPAIPDDRHFHCLRHTFCSLLAQRGVPAVTIRDLAGHASIQTSERYIHAFAEASHKEATVALNSIWA